MYKIYNTDLKTNKLEKIDEFKKGSWINVISPSDEEIKNICEKLEIKEDFIIDSLDEQEKPRIEIEEDDNTILFVIDVPVIEKENSLNYMKMMKIY